MIRVYSIRTCPQYIRQFFKATDREAGYLVSLSAEEALEVVRLGQGDEIPLVPARLAEVASELAAAIGKG